MYTVLLTVKNNDGDVIHSKQVARWSNELEEDLLRMHDLKFNEAIAEVLAESIHESITPEFIKDLLSK